jgi:eukaryotic-like serine/threonine-protein kinase
MSPAENQHTTERVPAPAQLEPGTPLAQYEILAMLGAGGMGQVYRARDRRLDREVAIKVLSAHLASDAEMAARFEREARAVAALSHPNILAIHEFGQARGLSFAVMELLEGESLRGHLTQAPLPWRRALDLCLAIADGLAAAHDRGIVHRDLKPDNIFVTTAGQVKILDFGLARTVGPLLEGQASAATLALTTQQGMLLGTYGYMSPEQVRGEPAGPPSDIFSVGCILYEMLTGRSAFGRRTPAESLAAVLREEPTSTDVAHVDAPPALLAVLAHTLRKDPRERFQSARDLVFALRALSTGSGLQMSPGWRGRRASGQALAVLPFVNASGDPALEYLSDGITESIINALTGFPKLRVVPRSTVFRYKGHEANYGSAALALNVGSVLTGRVLQRGDLLNIQTELIDISRESQLWGQQYTRRLADILEVQEEIAAEIAEALRLRLTGTEKKRLARRPTRNSEAYQEYLRGRYYWNKWSPEGFQQAIRSFEAALEKDPEFALAYVGLADAYGAAGYYGYVPSEVGLGRGHAAAQQALDLDSSLVEAQSTMAALKLFYQRDWQAAERGFRRAIEMNPDYAAVYPFYAMYHSALERHQEALRLAKVGRRLDPLSLVTNVAVAWAHYYARRYAEAIDQLRATLELDPHFAEAHSVRALIHEQTRQYDRAVAHHEDWLLRFGNTREEVAGLGPAWRTDGERGYWTARLHLLEAHASRGYVQPYLFLYVYAHLGDSDQAFAWMDRLLQERGGPLTFLRVDPGLDALRTDSRFTAALRQAGFPEP